jgi:iron complex transport system ATP-binding protein
MIAIQDLTVRISDREVLRDISLEIQSGVWTCLVGPNGAGKTTLLKTLLGTMAYSGSLRDGGAEVFNEQNRNVAYVPQQPNIPAGMSVVEYVSLGRAKKDGWGRETTKSRALVRSVLEETQLFGMQNRFVAQLSGGEMQRALIARALAQEPELILLDEPTSALDLHHQISVLNNIENLKERGVTIVSTMHDITLASMYAEQLVIMLDGRVTIFGAASEVIHSPELRKAFDNRIDVYTLDGGQPVIMASKEARLIIERETPQREV